MKLRKKQIKVPMNFSMPPWRIFIFYRGIFDFLGGVASGASKGVGVHRSHRLEEQSPERAMRAR